MIDNFLLYFGRSMPKRKKYSKIAQFGIVCGTWRRCFSASACDSTADLAYLKLPAFLLVWERIPPKHSPNLAKDLRFYKLCNETISFLIHYPSLRLKITHRNNKLPDDPVKYDFETVHNIDEYGADFDDSVRGSLKTWNMTVQYWLAVNIHRRFPIRALRLVAFDIC